MKRFSLAGIAAVMLAFAPAAWSATIAAITPDANRIELVNGKAITRFTVTGQGNEATDCGLWIEYGDNGSPDTRILGRSEGYLPRVFEHSFSGVGQFTVTAKGQRVKQTLGCSGAASTTVAVVDERRDHRRGSAAACPDGWQLVAGSFNRESGAFDCVPAAPAQRIDCGSGLRYFEGDNLVGCRSRGRGRDER